MLFRKILSGLILFLLLGIGFEKLHAITIHNKTDREVFFATYYEDDGKADRSGKIKKIITGKKLKISRPDYKWGKDRELIVSKSDSNLKTKLDRHSKRALQSCGIGKKFGTDFYIYEKDNLVRCCNAATWNIVKPLVKTIEAPFDLLSDKAKEAINKHPYAKRTAMVRRSNSLVKHESEFLKKRFPIIKKAQETFLGKELEDKQVLNIAFCCSGGGYRAMISTLGWMSGAKKIGLVNCANYFAGLSGSTWFMSQWTELGKTLEDLKKSIMNKVSVDIKKTQIDPKYPAELFIKKHILGQPLTSVDLYGSILANKLFSDYDKSRRQKLRLSTQRKRLQDALWLFPIYTAVEGGYPKHNWFEFTPYEIGSPSLGIYIPTWSLGRKFVNGKSKDFSMEQSLGYLMGIWGSAFTAEIKEMTKPLKEKLPKKVYDFFEDEVGEKRISPAKLLNPVYGMDDIDLNNRKEISLIDAGLDFNLPFPPLFRPERKVDLIVVCDASASAHKGAPAVRKAEKWAKDLGIKFPQIDYEKIGQGIISVFNDEKDPNVPTIIYMSLVKNNKFSKKFDPVKEIKEGFCSTFNFKYTNDQFKKLSGLVEFNVKESQEVIKKALLDKIEQKSK